MQPQGFNHEGRYSQPRVVRVEGSFVAGATGAVASNANPQVAATRTGTGVYTVSLNSLFQKQGTTNGLTLAKHVLDSGASVSGSVGQTAVLDFSAIGTGVVTIRIFSIGTTPAAADPASGASVHFGFSLRTWT